MSFVGVQSVLREAAISMFRGLKASLALGTSPVWCCPSFSRIGGLDPGNSNSSSGIFGVFELGELAEGALLKRLSDLAGGITFFKALAFWHPTSSCIGSSFSTSHPPPVRDPVLANTAELLNLFGDKVFDPASIFFDDFICTFSAPIFVPSKLLAVLNPLKPSRWTFAILNFFGLF